MPKSLRNPIFLLFLCLLGISQESSAQFTEAELSLNYHNLRFRRGDDGFDNTSINELRLNIGVVQRVFRNFGIGVQFETPLYSDFNANFSDAPTSNEVTYAIDENEFPAGNLDLQPYDYSYDIRASLNLSIFPRIYFSVNSPFYLDLRLNILNLREQFVYKRAAVDGQGNSSALPPISIDLDENHLVSGFGFRLGARSEFADHFYYTYSLTIDFYNFDDVNGFSYSLPLSGNGPNYDTILMRSMVSGSDVSWQFGYGIGYFF